MLRKRCAETAAKLLGNLRDGGANKEPHWEAGLRGVGRGAWGLAGDRAGDVGEDPVMKSLWCPGKEGTGCCRCTAETEMGEQNWFGHESELLVQEGGAVPQAARTGRSLRSNACSSRGHGEGQPAGNAV